MKTGLQFCAKPFRSKCHNSHNVDSIRHQRNIKTFNDSYSAKYTFVLAHPKSCENKVQLRLRGNVISNHEPKYWANFKRITKFI